jgi:hypothetical protein
LNDFTRDALYSLELLYLRNDFFYTLADFFLKQEVYDSSADLCIDGFPRSANSFAVNLIKHAYSSLNIIHHAHAPAVIKKVLKDNIPTFVLIRKPIDAIASEYIRARHREKRTYHVPNLMKRYYQYYQVANENIGDLHVIRFETVTDNPEEYMRYVFETINVSSEVNYSDIISTTKNAGASKITENNIYTISVPVQERNDYKEKIVRDLMPRYDFTRVNELYAKVFDQASV